LSLSIFTFNSRSDSSDDESKLGQIEANILDCLGEASQLGYSVPAKFRPPPSSTKGGEKRGKFNGRRPFRRGPMKAAEPTGDIKLRLGWANEAFIENNYEEAEQVIRDIIKINAETHEAWTILSSIQRELGDIPASVNSLAYAAILRPKDEQGWLKCAEYALNQTEGDRASFVDSAYFCYSSAIRANVNSIEGRLGKAEVKFEKGNLVGAVSEFSRVLKKFQPHNLRAVRGLGATYFDLGEFENAKELYKREFDFMRWPQNVSQEFIDWNDVAAYTAVYEKMGDFHAAIWELRSLARWLLGRESEPYFDISDDCEWDLDDARKTKLPEYVVGKFSPATYGEGLPPELRVKLAKCRFELGEEEEAQVGCPIATLKFILTWFQRHLDYFSYSGKAEHSYIIEYQLLYSDVAEYFMAKGSYQKAIYFFQQLKRVPELTSPSILINIAKCFQSQGLDFMTEDYFSRAIDIDEDNTEARLELAKMCETLGRDEQAFMYVNEVIAIKRNAQRIAPPPPKKAYRRRGGLPELSPEPVESVIVFKKKARYRPRKSDQAEQLREEMARINELQAEHQIVRTELDSMRAGDVESVQRWMEAARNMIDDFRSFKLFYPWDKYARFLGYSKNSRMEPEAPLDPSLAAMADRLSQSKFSHPIVLGKLIICRYRRWCPSRDKGSSYQSTV
jgi:general transcription factor 3C polypeptide 3 (transcription factor C subunit 4)